MSINQDGFLLRPGDAINIYFLRTAARQPTNEAVSHKESSQSYRQKDAGETNPQSTLFSPFSRYLCCPVFIYM